MDNNNSPILAVAPQRLPAFAFNASAEELKEQALATAAFVSKVENAEENEWAVQAQLELKRVMKLLEDAAQPYVDACNERKAQIWAERDKLKNELDAEWKRVSGLVGNFQMLEQAKLRAAEQLKNQQLGEIEREKAAALLKVKNHDEADAVAAKFNEKAAEASERLAPASPPTRAKGQTVVRDWDIKVTDPRLLAWHFPQCVTIQIKEGAIKELLKEGITPVGIEATEKARADVRLPRQRGAIAV